MATELGPGGIHAGMSPLEVAFTQLGVKEERPNAGTQVDAYIRSVRLDLAVQAIPWCACFTYWCCQQAGVSVPRTPSVKRLWERGKSMRRVNPRPGDIAIHLRANGTGHCGFYLGQTPDGMVWTIDGNTGIDDVSPADRVAIRSRSAAFWLGYLRPPVPRVT